MVPIQLYLIGRSAFSNSYHFHLTCLNFAWMPICGLLLSNSYMIKWICMTTFVWFLSDETATVLFSQSDYDILAFVFLHHSNKILFIFAKKLLKKWPQAAECINYKKKSTKTSQKIAFVQWNWNQIQKNASKADELMRSDPIPVSWRS